MRMFFEVSKKQNIDRVFGVIQAELRSQYDLGYVSDQPARVSGFRKIQLTTKQTGLVVQARNRYWAQRWIPNLSLQSKSCPSWRPCGTLDVYEKAKDIWA